MASKNPFEDAPINESVSSSDWTIDNIGSLRIYDDDGKWKTSGVVVNVTKMKKKEGLFLPLKKIGFDK